MKRIAVIGASGRGKSTWVKNFINDIPKSSVLINDVNGEYGEKYYSKHEFLSKVNSMRNCVCVFEEATIFFKGKSTEQMTEILVRARHTKNLVIMVFHSLRAVPADIFELIDSFIIFPTIERPDLVKSKYKDYPEIYEAWKGLTNAENEAGHKLHIFTQIDQ